MRSPEPSTLSILFTALEIGERNVAREFTDWLAFLSIAEERALYQLLSALLARFRSTRSAGAPPSSAQARTRST